MQLFQNGDGDNWDISKLANEIHKQKKKEKQKNLTLKAEDFLKFKEGAYYNYYSYVTFINKISFTSYIFIIIKILLQYIFIRQCDIRYERYVYLGQQLGASPFYIHFHVVSERCMRERFVYLVWPFLINTRDVSGLTYQ